MKNIIQQTALLTFIILLVSKLSIANEPALKVSADNVRYTSANSIEFDIYLLHTNPDESKFIYALGQYFFDFNPKISNGGTLTYTIVSSDLPDNLLPVNASVSGSILRLATNPVPSFEENQFNISAESPGTLIARMRLQTSAKEFSDVPFDLKCRLGPENPYTKICSYENNKLIKLTIKDEVNTVNDPKQKELTALPTEYALLQNYPNPFNPTTNIKFDLPNESDVRLAIYDITGREIQILVNNKLNAGTYEYQWNASQYPSGIYFYKITAGSFSRVKKMALVK